MAHVPRYLVSFRSLDLPHRFSDILVIGSGIAGLRAAISAASAGARTILITKGSLYDSNTRYAQGGIAAALAPGDSVESHIADTLRVGCGICDAGVVDAVIREGVDRVRELLDWGARFDESGGSLAFTLEGGHEIPRVLHAGGDQTGLELARALIAVLKERNVLLLEETFAIDLLTDREGCCRGALAQNPRGGREIIWSEATILATGGAGQLYRETTNPPVATGDGIAMGSRAGALLQDMEFVQFHPTTLYVAGSTRALISEALRGEGGILRDSRGRAFMVDYHVDRELAPRDVVSRAIVNEMRKSQDRCVHLDLTHLDAEGIRARFPFINELCSSFGLDFTREPIPVRPSAHYLIGGLKTDLDGATTVPGLFACGEVSSNGFHGANRLASNSLLEGLVMGVRAAQGAVRTLRGGPTIVEPIEAFRPEMRGVPVDVQDALNSLRSLMTYDVGIERDGSRLEQALAQVRSWSGYVSSREFGQRAGWELQNMLLLAEAVTCSACERDESRGVHFRGDHPEPRTSWAHHSAWSVGHIE